MPAPFTVDVFCRVIDNFGDAGVCLRLARALVVQHGFAVRLWCDDVPLLNRLEPIPAQGLGFHDWDDHAVTRPARGVICGFGCTLDDAYLLAMAACAPQAAYIHLEYLSAEPWVETTHGLRSTHPRLGVQQQFVCPGFNGRTAGLLHEAPANPVLGMTGTQAPLRVFVFGYPTAAFDRWIDAACQLTQPVHWVLPQGAAQQQFYDRLTAQGAAAVGAAHAFTRLPFVSQTQFDAALRSCDAAWVRGEDSAVTAMCAGIPMLWQLYPQDDGAHLTKLQAYLTAYTSALSSVLMQTPMPAPAATYRAATIKTWLLAMHACNNAPDVGCAQAVLALSDFMQSARQAPAHHHIWSAYCREQTPDLAATLALTLLAWKIL